MTRKPDPELRVGQCCGDYCKDTLQDQQLYKIPGIFRYRCARCFYAELGQHHWSTVPGTAPALITNQTVREALAAEYRPAPLEYARTIAVHRHVGANPNRCELCGSPRTSTAHEDPARVTRLAADYGDPATS